MKRRMSTTRRQFLRSAAAATAFTIIPRHCLGGAGAPSNKLRIAGIGVGGRGGGDIDGVSSEYIVALCDVDQDRAKGTFGKHANAKRYKDYRTMLDKEEKNIDAVVIGTPDHVHAPAAMMAIKKKKHVYCEKPLTPTISEAGALTEAAKEYGVVTQMGN